MPIPKPSLPPGLFPRGPLPRFSRQKISFGQIEPNEPKRQGEQGKQRGVVPESGDTPDDEKTEPKQKKPAGEHPVAERHVPGSVAEKQE